MNIVEQIKARLTEEFGEAMAELRAAWAKLKAFKFAQAAVLLYEAATGLVRAVEEIAQELGGASGAEKRKAVVEFLNETFDIPWIPEVAEGWLFGKLVDYAVGKLNSLHGKIWFSGGVRTGKSYFAFVKGALELEGQ